MSEDIHDALVQALHEKQQLERLQTQLETDYDDVLTDNEIKECRIAELEV